MKFFLIAVTLFTLTIGYATARVSGLATTESLFTGASNHHLSKSGSASIAESQFAQLTTGDRAPISSSVVLTLVALLVIAVRLMGLNHARAMADQERSSYHGKAQMFRALHDEQNEQR